MAYRQYTRCVAPQNHIGSAAAQVIIAAALGALPLLAALVAGAGVAPPIVIAVLTPIIAYCRWWLYDRLVCVDGGRDVCALGMVLSVEPASNKTGLDRFDTDYSVNLMLPPTGLGDNQHTVETHAYQGNLIAKHVNLPCPGHEVWDAPTAKTLIDIFGEIEGVSPGTEKAIEDLAAQLHLPSKTAALHVEFEGGGVYDLLLACLAALALATVAAVVCAAGLFGLLACLILSFVATLIALGGAALALGDQGNPSDVDPHLGELHVNDASYRGADIIVVKGSWVYDSAHEGWNEIHPIKHCQKTGLTWSGTWAQSGVDSRAVADSWCQKIADASAPATVVAQGEPQNGWHIHPVIDGCRPREPGGEGHPDPGPH